MSMRDDITPTNPQPIEVLKAQLDAFRKHPDDGDLYHELRAELRKSGQAAPLAEIGELRAPHERDRMRAADILSEAGEARLLIGDEAAGEADLRRALELDPANERAAARLAEVLMVAERFAEAAQILEAELEELDRRTGDAEPNGQGPPLAARRAHRHRMLAQLWDERLGRVDRALLHWQRAWQLEPERGDALQAARAIYASLGDEAMVARLYQTELDTLGEAARPGRRAKLEFELGTILARQGDVRGAAEHLEAAIGLDPGRGEAREALAEVYASPEFADDQDHHRRASELFVELGRTRLTTKDEEGAINYLRRALGVDPYSRSGTDALEKALEVAGRWDELDRLYEHRAAGTEEPRERYELLRRRAELYGERLSDRDALKGVLAEMATIEGPGGASSERLRTLYAEDEDWRELAALIEIGLPTRAQDPAATCAELLELATIVREHLGDRDRAAELLHRVLSIDPQNGEALARYADHFRERRDWRGLADLLDFAVDNARDAGVEPAELVRQLEDIAKLAELRLGDVERAIGAWRRIQEIEPQNPKVSEALRRLMSKAKMWEQLVGVLEQEAQAAQTPHQRAEALRRIAQVYRERQVNPRRAIALYEEILTMYPGDEGVLKTLSELYEREGDDAGLAHTLRRQLELDVRKMAAELEAQGRRAPTAREWPVAKRVERLTSLRRLAAMYEQRLADVEGVVFACTGILEVLPGDRDALDRMERVLEKANDLPRLEQTLEYHATAATGPAERAKVLRRLARIAVEQNDEARSMERWEQLLKAAPNDREALAALADLYERHGRWGELATALERQQMGAKLPEPGSAEASERGAELERYARVVDEKLGDAARAARAWQRVLEVQPRSRAALDALARLHEDAGRWRDLAEILALQAPLYIDEEPRKAAEVALRRSRLLEERLGAPAEAVKALEALLSDLDPANLEAHKALRRLYEGRGDFEAAVRIAEREMYLSEAREEKLARGLEIGFLCRDRLGDPTRALQAFERVLALREDHEEALNAAAELYARVGDWKRHIGTLERRIDLVAEGAQRRALMMRIAQATAERLGDPAGAFVWYRRAHDHSPDSSTIAELRRAAEAYGLWAELAGVYEDQRKELAREDGPPIDASAYVAACRELAAICERRLDDPERAAQVLRDALVATPLDPRLVSEVERIALENDDAPLWQILVDCLEIPLDVSDRDSRVALHVRRSRILEERLGDHKRAVEELLHGFSWAPEREETRLALYELAERTRAWSEVVAIESALLARAPTTRKRVEILRRKAQVVEDKLHESARAFRLHLVAFLIAPDNAETVAHLWRLARNIGQYREGDRTPRSEPPPAFVHPPATIEAVARLARPIVDTPRKNTPRVLSRNAPVREATQELQIGDLLFIRGQTEAGDLDDLDDEPAPPPRRRLETQPLELDDLVELKETEAGRDPTIELRTEDLIMALGVRDARPSEPPTLPALPPERPRPGQGAKAPPPPPRKPPQIKRRATPPPAPQRNETSGVRRGLPRLPAMPVRAYASPWEEFATAFELLPATDTDMKLRWLFRAAEVWETGAQDVGKAFDTLARALDLAPDDAEPRARLHRLAEDHDAWDHLAQLYESAAENASTANAAVSLLMDVAEIRALQNRLSDTELLYRRVLGIRPEDADARSRLEELYRRESRWVDLAASLEERTDPRLGTAAPMAERPPLLRELAALYRDRLGRTHDAIDALDRLRELAPEDTEVLRELADLYTKVGRWSKVIEMLGRIADLAEGSAEARDALRQVARIYERELELPDRAIDAYTQIVAHWPDDAGAYVALDELLETHARWNDLSEILRRRAGLTRDNAERAALLRRRAQILLEWLDAPEEAAATLRHARTIVPDEPGLADDLVQALVRSGREREAAAVLEGRLDAMRSADTATGDRAALLIRLAGLRADNLGDPHGARSALEEALELVPDHPTALAQMARLAASNEDPLAYARAKLREAEVLDDVDAKVEALLVAGNTLRDQAGDIDGARAAFEKVLALRPYHAAATWALAGLVEKGGDPDTAARLLEKRLEDESIDASEKALILTQLAALAKHAGVEAAAERRLDEALAIAPTHLPAVIALANMLYESERYADLEEFLVDALPRLDDAPPAALADLHRRLALVYEKLDRPQDAYQTLLSADRLHRGHLLVKLALGENRYRARRWREAALHLSALADHADAAAHPAEVAEGLYHAALAEMRSLRPEKAPALYERALELKPNYTPALHALAELAMEQGDHRRAADLLTRQASATDSPAERMRLFEALGDMSLMTLGDEDRARVCYEAAVNAANPLEARHVPLLEKLLERQDLASDHLGAARTAELMASFGADAQARAARYTAAAENYLAADEPERALAAAERAVEANPYDLTGVTVLSKLLIEREDFDRAADVLGRALSGDEGEDDELTAARKAGLWYQLAAARAARGDGKGAVTAAERAIGVGPDSAGAMEARRILLDAWKDVPERTGDRVELRRILAADTGALDDVVAYARALCRAGRGDGGRALLEVAMAMGHQPDVHDTAFLTGHPPHVMADDEAYRGKLSDELRAALIRDEDDSPMVELLATVWGAAALLWSEPDDALERCGVIGAERVSARTTAPAVSMFPNVAAALGVPATVLYTSKLPDAPDVQVVCVSAPIIVLGPRLLSRGEHAATAEELRFILGRAAEMARPERIIAAGLPDDDLRNLIASICRVFGPSHLVGAAPGHIDDPDVQRAHDELLRTTLPVKIRTRLEELLAGASARDIDLDAYAVACERAADRAGLLVCGNAAVAFTHAGTMSPQGRRITRHLLDMALSPRYLAARAALGIGVR